VVPSLKDRATAEFVRAALVRLEPAVIVTTTAFAAAAAAGAPTPFDATDVPVLQAVIATTKRAAWTQSPRGLGPADLAMHVVLPELDGRILQGAVAFKGPLPVQVGLCFSALASVPEPDRIAMLADRIAGLVRLQSMPRAERRVVVLLPDYPGASGRSGYAVGLDVPASVIALLADLATAGYDVADAPPSSRTLLDQLAVASTDAALPLELYRDLATALPTDANQRMHDVWVAPRTTPTCATVRSGSAPAHSEACWWQFPPDRGRSNDRRSDYHDATLPPRHALLAFGLWLRHVAKADALVHMGAHGTLEWLPGKAVALTGSCFPELVVGSFL
jgi:cobaltochelatase CobN